MYNIGHLRISLYVRINKQLLEIYSIHTCWSSSKLP